MSKIYVIGPMGSDRENVAKKIAQEKNLPFISLDKEIEEDDGRSPRRISMMMGEHAYHDKEYQLLLQFDEGDDFVMCCGDGVIFDSMCEDILRKGEIIVVGLDLSPEELWENAKKDTGLPYAFMYGADSLSPEDEKERFNTFLEFYNSRKYLYERNA